MATASRECGFINSEPCIAEFMSPTSQAPPGGLGPHGEAYGDVLGGGPGGYCPRGMVNGNGMPGMLDMLADHRVKVNSLQSLSNLKVPEYPWMKEKKTTKRGRGGGGVGLSIPPPPPPQSLQPPPNPGHHPNTPASLNGLGKSRKPQNPSPIEQPIPSNTPICPLLDNPIQVLLHVQSPSWPFFHSNS
jgi:hypothetical protein